MERPDLHHATALPHPRAHQRYHGHQPDGGAALGEALRNMPPDPVALPNMPESCPIVKFTARYREILLLVEAGLTNPAIADRLSISEHTVHTHLAEIYRRLHVGNRILAANVARQCGYLD